MTSEGATRRTVVWTTEARATITQDGVFTAPSKNGRYRVVAEYTPVTGGISLPLRAGRWVNVKPTGKSGDDSFSVDETPTGADPTSLELVLDVSNPSVVSNGGKPPTFTLTEARRVREISTYHWNDGKGTAAGGTTQEEYAESAGEAARRNGVSVTAIAAHGRVALGNW